MLDAGSEGKRERIVFPGCFERVTGVGRGKNQRYDNNYGSEPSQR